METEELKKAVQTHKPTRKAINQLIQVVNATNLDMDRVTKTVEATLNDITRAFMQRRYCRQEETIASVVIGVEEWLGTTTTREKHSVYVKNKVKKNLDHICTTISKWFKKPVDDVANAVGLACHNWLLKIYEENGL